MPPTKMLSRKEAAKKLKISVRTLDRYIRRGVFEVERSERSVWISEPSFEKYYKNNYMGEATEKEEISEVEEIPVTVKGAIEAESEPVMLSSHEHDYSLAPAQIYQQLYEEIKGKHDEQAKRLEGAHYRVGQLESQVKSMVPMLEFKKERKRLLLMDQKFKEGMKTAKLEVKKTKRLFESERFNKNVYIALVYGLLGLQPVMWLLLMQ